MIDAIKGIFNAISMIIDFIVFMVTGLFDFLGMLLKCIGLVFSYFSMLPTEIQLFAIAFMYIFVIMAFMQIASSIL